MKDLWIGKEKVIAITGWSAKWVEMQVTTGKLHAREISARGRNGKPIKEYCAASLPPAAQHKLGEERSRSLAKHEPAAVAHAPLFAALSKSSSLRIALVDERDRQKAAERLAVIRPLLDFIASTPDSDLRRRYLQCTTQDGTPVTGSNVLAIYLAEQHGVSARTIWGWYAAYKQQGGDVALADKRRADKNKSRWAARHPELAILAAQVMLGRKLSVTVAYENVRQYALATGAAVPSYETVRAYLNTPNEVSLSMKTLALEGLEKYESKFSPYLRRGFTDVAAGEIWESDHVIMDVLGQNDIFDNCDLQPIRMHLTTMYDYRSRYVLGFAFSRNGSSRSLAQAWGMAVRYFGKPSTFYCDNGKDYKRFAKYKGLSPDDYHAYTEGLRVLAGDPSSVVQRFGVKVTFCLPYHGQAKSVERFHGTLHERFCRQWRSYTGSAPHLRPDATNAIFAEHKGLMMMRKRGQMDSAEVAAASGIPLCSEIVQAFSNWLTGWYHAQPHRGEGMDGRSPREVFEQERWKGLKPVTPEEMATLLPERETRKVDSCAISIAGRRYLPASGDTIAWGIMHELTTQRVLVLFNPCDMDQVSVADLDGHHLCTLQAEVMMRQSDDAETRERISASMRQRRALLRGTRDSLAALSRTVVRSGFAGVDAQPESIPMLATGTDVVTQRSQLKPQRTHTDFRQPVYSHDLAKAVLALEE